MEKIKILPDFSFNEEAYDNVPKEIRKIVESNKYSHCSGWYLHGHLEDEICNDIAFFYDVPNELLKESADWCAIRGRRNEYGKAYGVLRSDKKTLVPHINGVYECEVYGTDVPCVGYFWTTGEQDVDFGNGIVKPVWKQRGLVVHFNDGEANAYARSKMSTRCEDL